MKTIEGQKEEVVSSPNYGLLSTLAAEFNWAVLVFDELLSPGGGGGGVIPTVFNFSV